MVEEEIRFDDEKDCVYDVIILGTGLVQCLLAAAVSKVGKRVLHIDHNDYYGEEWSSLDLKQFVQWHNESNNDNNSKDIDVDDDCRVPILYKSALSAPIIWSVEENKENTEEWAAILQKSRSYAFDMSPYPLYARGKLVDLLIRADVSKYLEFKLVEMLYMGVVIDNNSVEFHRVPISKSDVFQDKTMSMLEKRQLMKLLQLIMNNENKLREESQLQSTIDNVNEAKEQLETYDQRPFSEFLHARSLNDNVANMMKYCIAMQHDDEIETNVAMANMGMFIQSLGRYGNGAFLQPMYGYGEVGQAFSRLCAVSGGTYILRFTPKYLQIRRDADGMICDGIITPANQLLSCTHLITSRNYVFNTTDDSNDNDDDDGIIRCVCLVDKPLIHASNEHDSNVAMLTIPPSVLNESVIKVLQTDQSTGSCPSGGHQCILHLATDGSNNQHAETQLLDVLACIVNVNDSMPTTRPIMEEQPNALWIALYKQQQQQEDEPPSSTSSSTTSSSSGRNISNVYYTCTPKLNSVGYNHAIEDAERIFKQMYPNEEFFPLPPSTLEDKKPTHFDDDLDLMAGLSSSDDDDDDDDNKEEEEEEEATNNM